jgi:hypothetical protein
MGQCNSIVSDHHDNDTATSESSTAIATSTSAAKAPLTVEHAPSRSRKSRANLHQRQRQHQAPGPDLVHQRHHASVPDFNYEPNQDCCKDIQLPISLFQSSSTRSLRDIREATRLDTSSRRQVSRETSNRRLHHKIESRRSLYQRQRKQEPQLAWSETAIFDPKTRPKLNKDNSWYHLCADFDASNVSLDLMTATSNHTPSMHSQSSRILAHSDSWGLLSLQNASLHCQEEFTVAQKKKQSLNLSINDVSGNTLSTRVDNEGDYSDSEAEDRSSPYIQKIKSMAHPETNSQSKLSATTSFSLSSIGRSLSHRVFLTRPTMSSS